MKENERRREEEEKEKARQRRRTQVEKDTRKLIKQEMTKHREERAKMCGVCYEYRPLSELYKDEEEKCDSIVCKSCLKEHIDC